MTNKDLLKSIVPSAECKFSFSNLSGCSFWIIYAKDAQEREYIMDASYISAKDAWKKAANHYKTKMLNTFENK
jgi:hypothetical protein